MYPRQIYYMTKLENQRPISTRRHQVYQTAWVTYLKVIAALKDFWVVKGASLVDASPSNVTHPILQPDYCPPPPTPSTSLVYGPNRHDPALLN